jgi:hypothetical protein
MKVSKSESDYDLSVEPHIKVSIVKSSFTMEPDNVKDFIITRDW